MPESPRSILCKGTKKSGKEGGTLQEPSRHLKTSSSADFIHGIGIAEPSEAGKIKPLAHVSGRSGHGPGLRAGAS